MLSEKLENSICDFIEAARKQEDELKKKDKTIQEIVKQCEKAIRLPELREEILKDIIEEYKEAI